MPNHFKLANAVMQQDRNNHAEDAPTARVPDTNWREELLKNSSIEEAEPTKDSAQTGKSTETDQQAS